VLVEAFVQKLVHGLCELAYFERGIARAAAAQLIASTYSVEDLVQLQQGLEEAGLKPCYRAQPPRGPVRGSHCVAVHVDELEQGADDPTPRRWVGRCCTVEVMLHDARQGAFGIFRDVLLDSSQRIPDATPVVLRDGLVASKRQLGEDLLGRGDGLDVLPEDPFDGWSDAAEQAD
jgi:hypothetical protein